MAIFDPTIIERLSKKLNDGLATAADPEEKLSLTVNLVSALFGITNNEVAILTVDERRTGLHFVWPLRLKPIGFIPLSSLDSLAAETARSNTLAVENNFAAQPHASAFEKLRLESGNLGRPRPIQKLVSVPMSRDGQVIGVLQVSRKGEVAEELRDFTVSDAEILAALGNTLAHYL